MATPMTATKTGKSVDGFWDSPWGLKKDDGPPDRADYFPPPEAGPETVWACNRGLEDFLQHNGVFVNGIKGTPCHMDSYMTLVDYGRLDQCINLLTEAYQPTQADWKRLTDDWLCNPNTQPPGKIVGRHICGRFEIEPGTVDHSKWK